MFECVAFKLFRGYFTQYYEIIQNIRNVLHLTPMIMLSTFICFFFSYKLFILS